MQRRVFLEKRCDGTTSRDLAEASGLNVSMTNYYFRSKEKLFQLTFQDLHQAQFARLNNLVNADIPLREKIEQLIVAEYELGEVASIRGVQAAASAATDHPFGLLRAGGMGVLAALVKITRILVPGTTEVFPPWQACSTFTTCSAD